jgi:hypothetical protein
MKLKLDTILFFYDEPQVFSSLDEYGVHYISFKVEDNKFLTFKVRADDYNLFLQSKIDLLKLMGKTGKFEIIKSDFTGHEFKLEQFNDEIPSEWFPEADFVLSPFSFEELAVEARKTHSCIAELGILASESNNKLEIYSDKLSSAIGVFEKVFESVYLYLSKKNLSLSQKRVWPKEPPKLLFAGIGMGSFKVQLKSDESLDLFQDSRSEIVLQNVENILELLKTGNKEIIRSELKNKYGGKVATSLLKMSDFILKHETSLYFEWATPKKFSGRYPYDKKMANFLYDNFSDGEEISSEEVVYMGTFVKVDSINRTWSLAWKDEDEKIKNVKGKIENGQVSLNGIIMQDQKYRINCRVVWKFDFTKGKEVEELFLVRSPEEIE